MFAGCRRAATMRLFPRRRTCVHFRVCGMRRRVHPAVPCLTAGPCPSEVRERGAASGAHGAWDVRCGPGALGRAVADVRRDRSGRGGGTRHLRAGRHQPPSTAGASWSHSPVSSAYQAVLNRGSRSRGGTSSSHAQSVISTVMSNPRDREPTDRHAPGGRLRGRAGVRVVGTVRQASAAGDGHWVSNRTDGVCIAYVSRTFPEGGSACRWRRTGRRLLPLPSPPRTGRTENRRVVAPAERRRRARARPPLPGTTAAGWNPADHRITSASTTQFMRILRHLAKQTVRSRAISPVAGTRQLARRQRGRCSGRGMMVGVSVLGWVVVEGTVSPGLTYCLQGRSFG
jgi:hypothetical protein